MVEGVLTYISGVTMMASLIIALGAQNIYVLRQGARRDRVALVVAICIVSDVTLVALGVAGLGAAVERLPWLLTATRWGGALFLAVYGLLAARRAISPSSDQLLTGTPAAASSQSAPATQSPLLPTVLATFAFTWLNPGVYLDTVFLVGSVAATHGEEKWIFALGAMTASALWFTALGYGSRFIGRWLHTARGWQVLDGIIAVVMFAMALSLVLY